MNQNNIIHALFLSIEGKSVAFPEGPVRGTLANALIGELMDRWRNLAGSSQTSMHLDKLYRAENLRVENGRIRFEIERHAGIINGSTRVALYTWEIDFSTNSAHIIKEAHRQLKPMAKAYTKADAQKSALAVVKILTGRRKNRGELEPLGVGEFLMYASSFADLGSYQRTIVGRRKQFINALKEVLPPKGWCVSDSNPYRAEIYLQKSQG